MKLVCFILVIFSQIAMAQETYRLIGNDFGVVSMDLRDDSIEKIRYENTAFAPLNLGYYKFGPKSIFHVNLTYNRRKAYQRTDHDSYLTFQDYEIIIDFYKPVYSINETLTLYAGGGNHSYFFHYVYRDVQHSYDMGIANLFFKSLLELRKEKYQIMTGIGWGFLKYGSRADYPYLLGVNNDFSFRVTTVNNYLDLTFDIWSNINVTRRLVLSPVFNLKLLTNSENERLTILQQLWSIGIYYKL